MIKKYGIASSFLMNALFNGYAMEGDLLGRLHKNSNRVNWLELLQKTNDELKRSNAKLEEQSRQLDEQNKQLEEENEALAEKIRTLLGSIPALQKTNPAIPYK